MQHLLTYFTKLENNNMAQRKIFLCDDVNDESFNSTSQVCISPRTNTSIVFIRGATALTNLGRLSSRRWQSFPTAPDGTGLTCDIVAVLKPASCDPAEPDGVCY
jgi:hypothetical protein